MEAEDPGPGPFKIQEEPLVDSDSDKENVVEEYEEEGSHSARTRGKRSRRAKCVKVNYKDVSTEYMPIVRTKKKSKKRKLSSQAYSSDSDSVPLEEEIDQEHHGSNSKLGKS